MRPIDLLLSCLGGSAFAVGFVFARPSPPVGRRPLSITPTFARAVHFRFVLSRETKRTEYDSAGVANLAGEESVIREKLVALLDGQQHPYPLRPAACIAMNLWAGATATISVATKWGRSSPL